jgi:hypothetical protein
LNPIGNFIAGIGYPPRADIQERSIAVVPDLPRVGAHLLNHPALVLADRSVDWCGRRIAHAVHSSSQQAFSGGDDWGTTIDEQRYCERRETNAA